jgi:cyanophycinase
MIFLNPLRTQNKLHDFFKMHLFGLSMQISLLVGLSLLFSIALADDTEYGSARGKLVIIGGGSAAGTGIMERFVSLGGGPGKKFIIVPTANGNLNQDGSVRVYNESQVIRPWLRMGIKNVHMLHSHSPKIADTEDFVKELRNADAVWFDGGRQWNIVDSYAGTRAYTEFHKLLDRGGAIGGSSAGATIQGEYLVRGDTAGAHIVMTKEPNHQKGFAFLRRSAIDQHINTRNRWDDLDPVIAKYPRLLGIGLSEGTAIIVSGDTFEVMGMAKVVIHDNTRQYKSGEKPYFLLSAGDRYNMKTRRKIE